VDAGAAGYTLIPVVVDAQGNQDGIVCRLAMPEAFRTARCGDACPVPVIYNWQDDTAA
jgi:hypothetical protein